MLTQYHAIEKLVLGDVVHFRVCSERIHPFQDGNGHVGRLIMFRECLKHNIVPFIIDDDSRLYYYRGLSEWNSEDGFLMDTCLAAQDWLKEHLNYFPFPHAKKS